MDELREELGYLALIGGGRMGEAILNGLIEGALFDPATIAVAEPFEERRLAVGERYGTLCVASGGEIESPRTVILAVKPNTVHDVSCELSEAWATPPKRVISIAAGVTTASIQECFKNSAVVRVMPNLPLAVGAGMSVVAPSASTAQSEAELTCRLFSLMGEARIIEEGMINVATAVSGSGPAYFALFTEELAKAGEAAGLDAQLARDLAKQTLIGAARYLDVTNEPPEAFRQAVTSPNGTTQAALESFAADGFAKIVQHATAACIRRAEELA
ncbi:MAG: pyrroline-5-carboxylate reductase [Coriobacteriia bacterium]|nr:pyrroline-5-carboxylate reductase [Coriobacteriia bacterium]